MKNARKLISKLRDGTCTEEERELIEKWLLYFHADEPSELSDDDFAAASTDIWKMVQRAKEGKTGKKRPFWTYSYRIGTAAAFILFMLGVGLYFHLGTEKEQPKEIEISNDIGPGGNKAVLTLASGEQINLTDIHNGELAEQPGITITKTEEGQLVYTLSDTQPQAPQTARHIITTPKGGQYQVRLADGTNVWLNAASTLTYPTSFANAKERRVELEGEAYFEVAHDKTIPFKVVTDKQEVNVLGTHFIVNAYSSEPYTTTTLLEGAVQVSRLKTGNTRILKPGQQALVSLDHMRIVEADIDHEIAWKNGFFDFRNTSLRDMMVEFERWYDVQVQYKGTIPDRRFSGKIYRNINASEALQLLRYAGISYSIENDDERNGKMKIVIVNNNGNQVKK